MKKYMFLSAALLLFTASCSNDENNEQKEQTQAVQFSFTNEDFGEDETLTRSAETAKPQIVDLGDCEAEITVESEPAAKTRGALSPANGHYTIRAYQAGTLKDEMKGTFSAGTFTPDASSRDKLRLPYGTYDLVAFNDDVTVSGTNLSTTRDKAETARMGFATVNITSPTPIQVQFTMKHIGCRLRTRFVCQKDIPNSITAQLKATAANVIPTSLDYNPATKLYTETNGTIAVEANNSPASTETKYTASNFGRNYSYTSTSTYHYFLPTTQGSKLKLDFSAGTVFWKPIISTIPKLNATLSMQSGKSYLVKIKLKPNFTYLMSDGTTGFFRETTFGGGTKTPIAIVLDQTQKIAMALRNAKDNFFPRQTMNWTGLGNTTQRNKNMKTNYADLLLLEDGYHETWDASASTDNTTVKGLSADYPAFKAAGDYTPGVSLSGTLTGKKWYLPALGEWKYLYLNLCFGRATDIGVRSLSGNWYPELLTTAIAQVGGTVISYYGESDWANDTYWSSSEHFDSGWGSFSAATMYFWGDALAWNHSSVNSPGSVVRPFIRY